MARPILPSAAHRVTAICALLPIVGAFAPQSMARGRRDPAGGISPTCNITFIPSPAVTHQPITFDDNASDPDGTVVGHEWDFGDGGWACEQNPSHQYLETGSYTVALTVEDNCFASSTCTQTITVRPATVEVSIPLTETPCWHMIALPLEPVNKNILLDRATKEVDPESIFYDSYAAGNDPRNRLFRIEPGVAYWTYNPSLDPTRSWYEIGMEPPPGKPHPGPWWQGFWFMVDVPHTLIYTAYPLPDDFMYRRLDISSSPSDWAWMMFGACARVPEPYHPDVTTWPATSVVHDMMWGRSCSEVPPTEWLPTSDCDGPDARDQGLIGLPFVGMTPPPIVIYYSVSPSQVGYCGAPADTEDLVPGEAYWLDVEDPCVWLRLRANQWP